MISEYINEIAREIKFDSYEDFLKSDLWRKKKKEFKESRMPQQCIACGYPRVDLHHVCYGRLGRELLSDLVPVCNNCHQMIHHCDRDHERVDVILQYLFKWSDQETEIRFEKYLKHWDSDIGKPVIFWDFNRPFVPQPPAEPKVYIHTKSKSRRGRNNKNNKKQLSKEKQEIKKLRQQLLEKRIGEKLAKGAY